MHSCFRKLLLKTTLTAFHIVHPNHSILRDEAEETFLRFMEHLFSDIRHYSSPCKLNNAKLTNRVELSNRVDFFPKKFNPIWIVEREAEDINNSSPHRILSRLVDKVNFFKTVLHKDFVYEVKCVTLA